MFSPDTKVEGLVLYEPEGKRYVNYDCVFLPHDTLVEFLKEAEQSPNQFFACLRLCAKTEVKTKTGAGDSTLMVTDYDYHIPQARVVNKKLSLTLKAYRLVGESYLELMNSDPDVPSCIHIPGDMTPQAMDKSQIISPSRAAQIAGADLTPAQRKRLKLKAKALELKAAKAAETKVLKPVEHDKGDVKLTIAEADKLMNVSADDLQKVVEATKAKPTSDGLGKVMDGIAGASKKADPRVPPGAGFASDPQAKKIIDNIRASAGKAPGAIDTSEKDTEDAKAAKAAKKKAKRQKQNAAKKAKSADDTKAPATAGGFGDISATTVAKPPASAGVDLGSIISKVDAEAKKATDELKAPPKPEELLGLIQGIATSLGKAIPGADTSGLDAAMGGISGMLSAMGVPTAGGRVPDLPIDGAETSTDGPEFTDD